MKRILERKVIKMDEELEWHTTAQNSKDFAEKLGEKLKKRLNEHEKCEKKTRKERHAIFSQCFEEIIGHNRCFGPLLSEIKLEYENCIHAVLSCKMNAESLSRNLTSCLSGIGTIKNYEEQINDFEKKSKMLVKQNEDLKQQLGYEQHTMKIKPQFSLQELQKSIAKIRGRSFHRTKVYREREFGTFRVKVLERYSSCEQTNTEFLNEELGRLRNEIRELVKFFDKRFKLRETKDRLIEILMEKEQIKNDLKEQGDALKEKLLGLEEILKEKRKQRDLEMEKPIKTIRELILLALKRGETGSDFIETIEDELAVEATEEEEDQLGEEEQEEMVQFMERFEELFTEGCYEEAANIAVTSPQDFLRTAATFERFKEQTPHPGEKSPLLYYCEAVIANNTGQKGLSASESVDAVVRAIKDSRKELVMQWLSQNQLRCSEILGESIVGFCRCVQVCSCGYYTLAEAVYRRIKAHEKIVSCLCRQGRLHMAMHHARNVAKFRKADFMRILEDYPSLKHARVLLLVGDGYLSSPLRLEECITSLVRACRPRDASRLLTSAHDRIQCAKIIPYVCKENEEAWVQFYDVLLEKGFLAAARDVLSAWVLAEVFSRLDSKTEL